MFNRIIDKVLVLAASPIHAFNVSVKDWDAIGSYNQAADDCGLEWVADVAAGLGRWLRNIGE